MKKSTNINGKFETKKIAKRAVVTNCLSLNVRKFPEDDADVLVMIPALSWVRIDPCFEHESFARVSIESILDTNKIVYHGYCKKAYLAIDDAYDTPSITTKQV